MAETHPIDAIMNHIKATEMLSVPPIWLLLHYCARKIHTAHFRDLSLKVILTAK